MMTGKLESEHLPYCAARAPRRGKLHAFHGREVPADGGRLSVHHGNRLLEQNRACCFAAGDILDDDVDTRRAERGALHAVRHGGRFRMQGRIVDGQSRREPRWKELGYFGCAQ